MNRLIKTCCIAAVATSVSVGLTTRAQAAEFGDNTPYYEDDGWLDITEWFDGNDYNPTDEAWWRWDDEMYHASDDVSGDTDSDRSYASVDDNNWWSDNYDPYASSYYDYDRDNRYEFGSRYYDWDNDGAYDAYSTYSDWDGDGSYEDYDYFTFSDTGNQQQQQRQQQQAMNERPRQSQQQTVTGQIQQTRTVQVRGGQQHLIATIRPQQGQRQQQGQQQRTQQQQGQTVMVDLGKADRAQNFNLQQGDRITVKGPRAQTGNRSVIVARSIQADGQTHQINRNARTFAGKVVDTKRVQVRGQQHMMAIVQGQQNQQQKIAADLGPANQLRVNLKKGDRITFSGFPVKVKDKPLVIAQSLQKDGQSVQIKRQQNQAMGGSNSQGGSSSSSQQQQGQTQRNQSSQSQDQSNQNQNQDW